MDDPIMKIIKDPTLTYRQRLFALAKEAENVPRPIQPTQQMQWFIDRGIIFDMGEGHAPYRPRYVVPDYELFLKQGSDFLMLQPPKDIWEAVSHLLILYHHVPSTTGLPVYIGHLDALLEPYITDMDQARQAIRMLLTHVDRTISDSFCHSNIGPEDTKAGRIILELTAQMQRPVPNISLIYNEKTPDDFALQAIRTGLVCSKPSFANDVLYRQQWGQRYAIVSCYNALPIGGGGLTLGRLNLKKLADHAQSREHLMQDLLPRAVQAQCQWMDMRNRFIIEDSAYFENSFLADEGLISPDQFVGMFGLIGLAQCVNTVLGLTQQDQRYGHGQEAAAFGQEILDQIAQQVKDYQPTHGKFYLHGQVGISTDIGVTPNVRIPIGEEPELPQHLMFTAKMHRHFDCGVGDIFPFDQTAKNNPQAVLDIIRGSFMQGMRYFSYHCSDADLIRITGYLVKRSDIEKLDRGKQVLGNTTVLGSGATKNLHVLDRRVRHMHDNRHD